MNTPTHFLTVAALDKWLQNKWENSSGNGRGHDLQKQFPVFHKALLIGSIAPDIPLYLLCLGAGLYYHYIQGWEFDRIFNYVFNDLFFNNPVWITLHNFPHSPLVLLTAIVSLWRFRNNRGTWQRWGFWFAWGCLLHTSLDIPTHVDDGPLVFFPLNWTWRYASPISYWDERYYGAEVARMEAFLDALLILYLCIPWLQRKLKSRI
ncbi:MAG: metal-dependent hydrolase, partial [Prochlorotrichaceae cyanobacterium]